MVKILRQKDFIFPLAGIVGAPLCDLRKKDALEINQKNVEFIIPFQLDSINGKNGEITDLIVKDLDNNKKKIDCM